MAAGAIRTTVAMGLVAGVLAAGFIVSQRAVPVAMGRSVADAQRVLEGPRAGKLC